MSRSSQALAKVTSPEVGAFLTVGAIGYVVDVTAFNVLRSDPFLGTTDPAYARIIAVIVAMVVTYLGNRLFTWRGPGRGDRRREILLFAVFNMVGLALSVATLVVSHDLLGLTSRLADNISANGVGLALGTLFRYWSYRTFVFGGGPPVTEPRPAPSVHSTWTDRRVGVGPTPRRRSTAAAWAAALLLGLVGCGSTDQAAPAPKPSTRSSSASAPAPTAPPPTAATPSPTHKKLPARTGAAPEANGPQKVLVVIEENHSYEQMKQGMPFLAGLSAKYGYATHWTALAHPSLPNYLGIAGGSTFGILDDRSPAAHTAGIGSATSVFDQALAAGKTAGTYAETMPKNCHVYDSPDRAVGTPTYAVRHNPWVYFSAGRSGCEAHDTDLAPFAGDAAKNALPHVGFLIPDLEHDAHDASLATADTWLREQLTPVLHSTDFTSGKLVVVVTADEDDRHSDNAVLTSVLTPRISHVVVTTPLTHYSLTRFIAQVLGVQPLRNGATAPDMKAAFGL